MYSGPVGRLLLASREDISLMELKVCVEWEMVELDASCEWKESGKWASISLHSKLQHKKCVCIYMYMRLLLYIM